jgi:hypothetical protein
MKAFIWGLALVGITYPCLLAVMVLESNVRILRARDGSSLGAVGLCCTNGPCLELNPRPVPALLTLAGAACFLVGLFFLIPRQPQYVRMRGLDAVPIHVRRFLASRRLSARLSITASDPYVCVYLTSWRRAVDLELWGSEDACVEHVHTYFRARGIEPLAGDISGTTHRGHSYPLPRDAGVITATCRDLLVIFGVTESTGLTFDHGRW